MEAKTQYAGICYSCKSRTVEFREGYYFALCVPCMDKTRHKHPCDGMHFQCLTERCYAIAMNRTTVHFRAGDRRDVIFVKCIHSKCPVCYLKANPTTPISPIPSPSPPITMPSYHRGPRPYHYRPASEVGKWPYMCG